MCEVCVNNNSLIVNRSKSYDPTHTTTLRNTMVRASNRRFDELIRVIRKAVDEDDCFGLKEAPAIMQLSSPGNRAFSFGTSEQKVREFLTWLNEQVKKGLLTVEEIQQVGESIYPIWTNKFISDSYRRGV